MIYENARRAGRTHPDLVEVITAEDPRHPGHHSKQPKFNRADRRARGFTPGRYRGRFRSPRPVFATEHPLNSQRLRAEAAVRTVKAEVAA